MQGAIKMHCDGLSSHGVAVELSHDYDAVHDSPACGRGDWQKLVSIHMKNSTTEHDMMKLITPFYSESTTHSNDINISYEEKIPEIGENPLIIDLAFCQNFAIFAMCSKQ